MARRVSGSKRGSAKKKSIAREYSALSGEQQAFVDAAIGGGNVLVDACIGSGKTTAIQSLCNQFDVRAAAGVAKNPKTLYLTYNRLLKLDAQDKIQSSFDVCWPTNYHGFSYRMLKNSGMLRGDLGQRDCLQMFNECWRYIAHKCPRYDCMIIDEYQDIDQQCAILISNLVGLNPDMQIIAVGDMCQKIYDNTTLDARRFISQLLGGNAKKMEFTQCFRLSAELAANIGTVWGKPIIGVNDSCEVEYWSFDDTYKYISQIEPGKLLCLGGENGRRVAMQNMLETNHPEIFNKETLWASTKLTEGGSKDFKEGSAIFTTYDGCKGLERPVCVVFDWDLAYWDTRLRMHGVRYEILRNIFLVAASRGKEKIIFVRPEGDVPLPFDYHKPVVQVGGFCPEDTRAFDELCVQDRYGVGLDFVNMTYDYKRSVMLTWDVLSRPQKDMGRLSDMQISSMFDFKHVEHIDEAYKLLDLCELPREKSNIDVNTSDGYIDLSACIGMYQEFSYFSGTHVDTHIMEYISAHRFVEESGWRLWPLDKKVRYLASLETGQMRYLNQVDGQLLTRSQEFLIKSRLKSELPHDAAVQQRCVVYFDDVNGDKLFSAIGRCDVIYDRKLWELKFVSALEHTHFLQTAMYMIGHDMEVGRLWNVRTNQMFEVRIPDREAFLNAVVKAATKGEHIRCIAEGIGDMEPPRESLSDSLARIQEFCVRNLSVCEHLDEMLTHGKRMTAYQVEEYFGRRDLRLPVPVDMYLNHSKACLDKVRQELAKLNFNMPACDAPALVSMPIVPAFA